MLIPNGILTPPQKHYEVDLSNGQCIVVELSLRNTHQAIGHRGNAKDTDREEYISVPRYSQAIDTLGNAEEIRPLNHFPVRRRNRPNRLLIPFVNNMSVKLQS